MKPPTKLIRNAHLFTMSGDGVGYIKDGELLIEGSKIASVGPPGSLTEHSGVDEMIDATGFAVLPGFVDAHMHTQFALLRGVAQDIGDWMQKGLAPFEKHMDQADMLAGSKLALIEAIRFGTTTFGDYARPVEGWAELFAESGVRAILTPLINSLPEGQMAEWPVGEIYPLDDETGRKSLTEAIAFADQWETGADGRISVMFGPQGPDMLSEELLKQVKEVATQRSLGIHLHTAQGDREIDQMLKRYGQRTPAFLDRIGYLDDQLLAVHLTEATVEETETLVRRGCRMALCSGSIGIIDGIVPPGRLFRDSGGLVALGSDQASGNNTHNIFYEMKATALFNKIRARDPEAMPAWQVLRMATIEGASAIGIGDRTGSLETGKQADIIFVDLGAPNLQPVIERPVRNIVPNLVYAATGYEVLHSMVAGNWILRDGKVQTLCSEEILADIVWRAERVGNSVAVDPASGSLSLLRDMDQERL